MSEAKHTPGPWTNREYSTFVHSPHGNVCACGDPHASTIVGYTEADIGNLDEPVANARLIAAAPDLLAVVRELVASIADKSIQRNPAYRSDDIKWLDERARAAIAKAEGQP